MSKGSATELYLDSQAFFTEVVQEACEERKLETFPQATNYLVELMVFYINTSNLYDEECAAGKKTRGTLAEMLLKASNAAHNEKVELLKRLGDTALYVSGFFSESLERKLVNVDYYKDMGATAYGNLASCVGEDGSARVYEEISSRFIDFADVLAYISSKAIRPNQGNLLQLFERYASGSDMARDELLNQGVIAVPGIKNTYNQ